jgi:hypothetical protein
VVIGWLDVVNCVVKLVKKMLLIWLTFLSEGWPDKFGESNRPVENFRIA